PCRIRARRGRASRDELSRDLIAVYSYSARRPYNQSTKANSLVIRRLCAYSFQTREVGDVPRKSPATAVSQAVGGLAYNTRYMRSIFRSSSDSPATSGRSTSRLAAA